MNETVAPEFSPPYSRYAEVYDRLNQSAFSARIAQAVLMWLEGAGYIPANVLDLACGTGAATRVYAKHGCRVVGLDKSPHMLAFAESPAEYPNAIRVVEGNLRELDADQLGGPFDLVSCYFDSINYLLTIEDLAACFQAVYDLTAPDGYFVFDVPTRRGYAEQWDNVMHIVIDEPDLFGLYQSWFDPATQLSPLRLTFFQRELNSDAGSWLRFDECHIERAYALDELASALDTAGFTSTGCVDVRDNGATLLAGGDENAHRVAFLARRFRGNAPTNASA